MGFLTKFLFILNVLAWIVGCIIGFAGGGFMPGLSVIIGFITFYISWRLSGKMIVSTWDTIVNPEWDVFKKQLGWANGVGISVFFVFFAIFGNN